MRIQNVEDLPTERLAARLCVHLAAKTVIGLMAIGFAPLSAWPKPRLLAVWPAQFLSITSNVLLF